MKVLAATADGMWEIHEVRDESLLDTHTSVSWTLVHLPSGDTTRSFGWTESREGGAVTRSGDREIRFAADGAHAEVTREDGHVEKIPLEWPVPPAKTPADAQMPEDPHLISRARYSSPMK
jgi:hypothetical protein